MGESEGEHCACAPGPGLSSSVGRWGRGEETRRDGRGRKDPGFRAEEGAGVLPKPHVLRERFGKLG